MSFEDTTFFKEFGDAEWKVTTADGKIHKSKKWLLKYEDVIYKEVTPHTSEKTKIQVNRKKSNTIVQTRFK
jgi:lipopolysaccharide export system protein LptC